MGRNRQPLETDKRTDADPNETSTSAEDKADTHKIDRSHQTAQAYLTDHAEISSHPEAVEFVHQHPELFSDGDERHVQSQYLAGLRVASLTFEPHDEQQAGPIPEPEFRQMLRELRAAVSRQPLYAKFRCEAFDLIFHGLHADRARPARHGTAGALLMQRPELYLHEQAPRPRTSAEADALLREAFAAIAACLAIKQSSRRSAKTARWVAWTRECLSRMCMVNVDEALIGKVNEVKDR